MRFPINPIQRNIIPCPEGMSLALLKLGGNSVGILRDVSTEFTKVELLVTCAQRPQELVVF